MFLELFKGDIFTLTIQIKFSNLFSTFIEPTSSTNVQNIFKNFLEYLKNKRVMTKWVIGKNISVSTGGILNTLVQMCDTVCGYIWRQT